MFWGAFLALAKDAGHAELGWCFGDGAVEVNVRIPEGWGAKRGGGGWRECRKGAPRAGRG